MLKMRLQRIGRKNDPKFRIVVTESQSSPVTNKHVDLIGSYDAKMGEIKINAEKAKYWLSVGVQASDTVHNMLIKQKITEGKTRNSLPKKTPIKKEVTAEENKKETPIAPVEIKTEVSDKPVAEAVSEPVEAEEKIEN